MTRPRIIATLLIAIMAATMVPTPGVATRPFSFCLTCDFRWLADGLANVALFVPLGCAMNWKGRHLTQAAFRLTGLAVVVELLQTAIPGRDPALGDIVANSLGGILGALLGSRPSAWLAPSPRLADRLLALTIILIGAIVGGTGWVLAPSSSIATYSARSNAVAALFRGQATMVLTTVSDSSTTEQTLLSLGPPAPFQVLYVGRVASDAVLRYRSRGRDLRLDEPEYLVSGFFGGTRKADTVRISVFRRGPEWCLARTGRAECGVGPTVGRGWAFLRYPYSFGRRWQRLVDMAWAATLFLPLGFWSRRGTVAVGVLAAAVILGPFAWSALLVPTPMSEWLGALTGFSAGLTIGYLLRRRQERIREEQVKSMPHPPLVAPD